VWAQPSGAGFDFAIGDILTWVFRVQTNAAIDWSGGFIKYAYVDAAGNRVAGLLAEDIPLQDCPGCAEALSKEITIDDCSDCSRVVPEPGSLALFGLAWVASYTMRRRSRIVG
jgi:hypothetical protein